MYKVQFLSFAVLLVWFCSFTWHVASMLGKTAVIISTLNGSFHTQLRKNVSGPELRQLCFAHVLSCFFFAGTHASGSVHCWVHAGDREL